MSSLVTSNFRETPFNSICNNQPKPSNQIIETTNDDLVDLVAFPTMLCLKMNGWDWMGNLTKVPVNSSGYPKVNQHSCGKSTAKITDDFPGFSVRSHPAIITTPYRRDMPSSRQLALAPLETALGRLLLRAA